MGGEIEMQICGRGLNEKHIRRAEREALGRDVAQCSATVVKPELAPSWKP